MPTIADENILNTIDLIYEGACDSSGTGWQPVYESIAKMISSGQGSLHIVDKSNYSHHTVADTHAPGFMAALNSTYYPLLPYRKCVDRLKTGAFFDRIVECPDDIFLRSESYQDYLKLHDIYQVLLLRLKNDDAFSVGIGFSRPATAPNFGKDERRALALLSRHLQRGMDLYVELIRKEIEVNVFSDTLTAVDRGIVLVDQGQKITFMNRAAEELIAANGRTKITGSGSIDISEQLDGQRLERLISGVFLDQHGQEHRGGTMIVEADGEGATLSIMVVPILPNSRIPGESRRKALIAITDTKRLEVSESKLQELYALTPAESRLSSLIASGKSLKEAAKSLNVSQHTVRTHLKRIFEKTDTHQQSSLVSLILGGDRPH